MRRLHALDPVARERVRQPVERLVPIASGRDGLREQWVVVDGHHAAGLHAAFVAEAGSLGELEDRDRAGRGQEVAIRVLGVDPALDCRPPHLHITLGPAKPFAGGDAELSLDEIAPHDLLRDGVLDLEPRVHLQEVEAVPLHQELDGPGVPVAGRLRHADARRVKARPQVGIEPGGRRLLDQLLMPPLDRAIALEEVDQRPVLVGEDLDLDVPGPLDGPLDVDGGVPERGPRAPLGGGERRLEPIRPG